MTINYGNDLELSSAIQNFDLAPASMLVSIKTAEAISGRSRASIYRHFASKELELVKVGGSTRIRVGDLRRLIGA